MKTDYHRIVPSEGIPTAIFGRLVCEEKEELFTVDRDCLVAVSGDTDDINECLYATGMSEGGFIHGECVFLSYRHGDFVVRRPALDFTPSAELKSKSSICKELDALDVAKPFKVQIKNIYLNALHQCESRFNMIMERWKGGESIHSTFAHLATIKERYLRPEGLPDKLCVLLKKEIVPFFILAYSELHQRATDSLVAVGWKVEFLDSPFDCFGTMRSETSRQFTHAFLTRPDGKELKCMGLKNDEKPTPSKYNSLTCGRCSSNLMNAYFKL